MAVQYAQKTFSDPEMAKTMTEWSQKDGILEGWELVCIHPAWWPASFSAHISPDYVATFRKITQGPGVK